MIRLKMGEKFYKIFDDFTTNKSSREVTFNNINVDFTGQTIDDLPIMYQECTIGNFNENGSVSEVYFTGYINNYKLPDMILEDEDRILELELLSPMALATHRCVSAVGTFQLLELIDIILQPLFADGFVLKELNLPDKSISVNYLLETIEKCLNRLSNKNNFWWYIDENKNIYINDIDYLFSLNPTFNYDDKWEGLFSITPSAEATDYCNVINFTNVRVYMYSYDFTTVKGINKDGIIINPQTYELKKNPLFKKENIILNSGDTINFDHAVDTTIKNITKSVNVNGGNELLEDINYVVFEMKCTNESNQTITVSAISDGSKIQLSSNLQFSGTGSSETEKKDFEFITDSFFSNLVTGIRYNGSEKIKSIESIISCSALMWTRMKFVNSEEIEKCKNKISLSGQIEKTIDLNETWKTLPELKNLAQSYMTVNSGQTNEVKLKVDNFKNINYNLNFNIGNIVRMDKKSFFLKNDYIVTDISTRYEYSDKLYKTWEITLKSKNCLDNFIDLFRGNEKQEINDKVYNYIVSNYTENSLLEIHEVV